MGTYFLQKYITTIIIESNLHTCDSIIIALWTLVNAPMALYRYFKPVSKSLPDPEGLLSETPPSATIKAANEAVLAA